MSLTCGVAAGTAAARAYNCPCTQGEFVAQLDLSLHTLGRKFPSRVLRDESYWAHNSSILVMITPSRLSCSEASELPASPWQTFGCHRLANLPPGASRQHGVLGRRLAWRCILSFQR